MSDSIAHGSVRGGGKSFTAILPEEFHALMGLSNEAFRLYMYLRQFMIRSSGECSGAGVSWPEIARDGLYVAPRSGVVGGGLPDKRKMMRVRDELLRENMIESVGDGRTFLKFRFPIFIQSRDLYFYARKQAAPNPHPQAAPNPHHKTQEKTISYNASDREAEPAKTPQAAPYTEVTEVNKELVVKSKDRANSEPVGLTNLQNDYFACIADLGVFRVGQLHDSRKMQDYRRMLVSWEAAGVELARLPVALNSILGDLTARNGRAYSPLYFSDSVLRWMDDNKPMPMPVARRQVGVAAPDDGKQKRIPFPPHWLDEPALRAYQHRHAGIGAPSSTSTNCDTLEGWWSELKIWCRRYNDGMGMPYTSGLSNVSPLLEAFKRREAVGL